MFYHIVKTVQAALHQVRREEMMAKRKSKPWEERTFSERIDWITGPLVTFIQHDEFVEGLKNLEAIKEDIESEFDMYDLDRVITGLASC